MPNGPAQQALIRQALTASRLEPADIDYLEAHGTGTALGDPIELDALSEVFDDRGGSAPLVFGSVKTNLGHLESGAGITGFIKTVLGGKHGHIPQHLHFTTSPPMPAKAPPASPSPRRHGMARNSARPPSRHVLVRRQRDQRARRRRTSARNQSAPAPTQPHDQDPDHVRKDRRADRLHRQRVRPVDVGAGVGAGVAEVAHTFNHHRARHPRFATVCARDRGNAVEEFAAVGDGRPAAGVARPHAGLCRPGTVLVSAGQGSQWAGMGRRLLADEPVFAEAMAEMEPEFVERVGFSLLEVLAGGELVSGDARVQPVIMGLQLALTQLWRSYGVSPDAVIGHSMGEVTAAVVAGASSAADGLRVIATRSRLMSRLAGQGAVAFLELDADTTEELSLIFLRSECGRLCVAEPDRGRGSTRAGVDAVIAAGCPTEAGSRGG